MIRQHLTCSWRASNLWNYQYRSQRPTHHDPICSGSRRWSGTHRCDTTTHNTHTHTHTHFESWKEATHRMMLLCHKWQTKSVINVSDEWWHMCLSMSCFRLNAHTHTTLVWFICSCTATTVLNTVFHTCPSLILCHSLTHTLTVKLADQWTPKINLPIRTLV